MRYVHTARAVAVAAIVASTAASAQTSQVSYWPHSIVKRVVANAAALPTCDAERENWIYALVSEDEWRWCQSGSWVALGGGAPPSASEVSITDAGACYAATDVEAALAEIAGEVGQCAAPTAGYFYASPNAGGAPTFRLITPDDIGAVTGINYEVDAEFSISYTLGPALLYFSPSQFLASVGNGQAQINVDSDDPSVALQAASTELSVTDGDVSWDGDTLATISTNVEDFPTADTNDGYVLTSDGLGGAAFEAAAGGGVGGSTGAADNALLCSDGTGGATLQACNAASSFGGTSLTGPSGGFTLFGGPNTGDDIVLDATSHATATGSNVYVPDGVLVLRPPTTDFAAAIVGDSNGVSVTATRSSDGSSDYSSGAFSVRSLYAGAYGAGSNAPIAIAPYAGNPQAALASSVQFGWTSGSNASDALDAALSRASAAIVKVDDAIRLDPVASAPVACSAGTSGTMYMDSTSSPDELCVCDGSSYQPVLTGGDCT